jgi:hypothetical protein
VRASLSWLLELKAFRLKICVLNLWMRWELWLAGMRKLVWTSEASSAPLKSGAMVSRNFRLRLAKWSSRRCGLELTGDFGPKEASGN